VQVVSCLLTILCVFIAIYLFLLPFWQFVYLWRFCL
jgi:hypothetical protein